MSVKGERALFEQWVRRVQGEGWLERRRGFYAMPEVRLAWRAWQERVALGGDLMWAVAMAAEGKP